MITLTDGNNLISKFDKEMFVVNQNDAYIYYPNEKKSAFPRHAVIDK